MNINSIRGKKLELLAFLDFHQPHVVAIQETKIDSSIETSELLLETCPYSVYRKDRNIHGGGVMLLVHKDISHMPITELENDSESIWVKVFANKTSHFVASWYGQPGSTNEEFQLFREQLDYIRTHHKGKKLHSVHVLGDFNFIDIDWPDTLSKSGSMFVTKWIKSCLLQCFSTFKMPILMFISILVFRPGGQIWNPVRRDTRIYVRRILNASHISKTQLNS